GADRPDCIVVARDANCKGFRYWEREMDALVPEPLRYLIVHAVPDPHIERWLLLDSAAFAQAVGRGCGAPDRKCQQGRYKQLLVEAVQRAGKQPQIGGLEHTEAIVSAMDLERMQHADPSLGRFLR